MSLTTCWAITDSSCSTQETNAAKRFFHGITTPVQGRHQRWRTVTTIPIGLGQLKLLLVWTTVISQHSCLTINLGILLPHFGSAVRNICTGNLMSVLVLHKEALINGTCMYVLVGCCGEVKWAIVQQQPKVMWCKMRSTIMIKSATSQIEVDYIDWECWLSFGADDTTRFNVVESEFDAHLIYYVLLSRQFVHITHRISLRLHT